MATKPLAQSVADQERALRASIGRSRGDSIAQTKWHRKPKGDYRAPCSICGCPATRLTAEHRAVRGDESYAAIDGRSVGWIKRVSAGFGGDHNIIPLTDA